MRGSLYLQKPGFMNRTMEPAFQSMQMLGVGDLISGNLR